MARLWPIAILIGIGLALFAIAPSAQTCTTWSDGSVCETGGTIILNIAGGITLLASIIWGGLVVKRV